jgi:aminopeptidase Y
MILWHNYPLDEGEEIPKFHLSRTELDMMIPVGVIPNHIGREWSALLKAGKSLQVTLTVDSILESRPSWNIISQTKQGDPDKVIMLGAHLDSVPDGPGINDDGSGTAALLEIMEAVERYDGYPHAIRFAWWGAEEFGLVGSLFYTQNLEPEEVDKIKYYFNYDMIGSPYPKYEITWGVSSGIGMDLLEGYLAGAGKEVSYAYGTTKPLM